MRQVFIDTSALLALANANDAHHAAALRVRRELSAGKVSVVTSQWVLTEFLNSLSAVNTRSQAVQMVSGLTRSARTSVVEAGPQSWSSALDLYRMRPDKGWSLVDCTSILICQEQSIQEVFTNDQHFAQAGLNPLLP